MAPLAQTSMEEGGYVQEIAGLKTQFDIFRFMKRVTETYRSRAFMVLNLPPVTSLDLQGSTVITSWPAELLALYDQEGLLVNSPVLRRLRTSTCPFFYDMSRQSWSRDDGKSALVTGLFERFRMTRCAYFPTHEPSGQRGAVSFAGDREPFSPTEMRELCYIAIHVFDRLAEIRNLDNRMTDTLTDREIDCLNWTAAGKTSAEIAEILALSEHTVNHYLNRATKKLDTVNRTQAVAKALRIGLIK
ncbi:LuxR family transcriptional regulator [Rhizobium lentis]|uniref:LuxR family transcriptional regulator n=1 Tax=Rhizobium lentis TaxID=1138194 RepID=A0A9Q3MD91_9HYPH|nr:autoinducer binding domain-containing protein [Rhizobium lentis]MBX4954659.1 LuxR family transcriptional regulator [Rhizobium lentis]MBX4976603.1 LuxR family transcriptional regulator [Rhizobium lentis]MBX4985806.1 LuxR family transcriptional regulator [Rhizobium lentis]MBX4997990.1 LuxR family transcriptional regulator [Rhizobium lentis]MBX5004250.1 LuxR family transcriptional regulator [Rhizobium lentis]